MGAPRPVAGDPGTQHAGGPGRTGSRVPEHTGHRTQGAGTRGLAARRASRASWPVGGSQSGPSPPPTSRPALKQSPGVRGSTAPRPTFPGPRPLVPQARSPQLTCLAPPPQASSAPPRPGTEDSPRPQPIARRAGVGGGSDTNVRQSPGSSPEAPDQWEGVCPAAARKGRGGGGTRASVGGAGAPGLEGPRLGRSRSSSSVRIRVGCGGFPAEFHAGLRCTQKSRFLQKVPWAPGHLGSVALVQRSEEAQTPCPAGGKPGLPSLGTPPVLALCGVRSFCKYCLIAFVLFCL